ncbi:GNAT family N-acetyltransferase [Paenibacillus albiflavus]|uniref:GNAT family N-acetyltransferase n=1 Tax=Paenibacillus albiflavus TaxID=2545760 RepID=A0A4R4EE59_9BACL|nr:GNAT family N-acetyltransferase [Paenibacillus albiflavus]TCZ77503.1 GNAT family N-acetyltransferase [Paenibacillus albiflavus]
MEKLNGIVASKQLNPNELEQVRLLSQACLAHDGLRMKLNWNTLSERNSDETNDFLMYQDGQIVGFLGLYSFGSAEVEVSGLIHPDYRRRGLFRSLLDRAIVESRNRKFSRMLLISPGSSESGKAFVQQANASYSFSEYYMERHNQAAPVISEARTRLRTATIDDAEILHKLNQSGFSMSYEESVEWVTGSLNSSDDINLIAELDGVPIAKLGVMLQPNQIFIFGFCVASEYQGKGHGRNILKQTIAYGIEELGQYNSALEVSVSNEGALGLYLSCGFQTVSSYDYFLIQL